ncbi:alpha/beta hydrolase fold domain-containing protein [Pseudoalteromonas sp. NBT06-2]|uniref:alpha/beta hydrolase fold domain-containing protein n=1 Tax=Pseudoalteromonas sp. NBT06-2 TaxID=2025950 RepID=UPI0011410BD7|nr:alpha/beta hydrolase fold domain-containing protein [Pseudoalteromonas sp. NBT06-2]
MTTQRITVVFSLFWSISYLLATVVLWIFGRLVDINDGNYDPSFMFITIVSSNIFIGSFFLPETGKECQQLVLEKYTQALSGLNSSSQLYIAGDSAGGAICATLSMNNINNKKVKIDKQILIYPSLDYTMSLPSISENGQGYLLESQKIAWYFDHYFQNNEDRVLLSPLFGPISSNLPDTLIFTAGYDPLKDEGFAYVKTLKKNNTSVQHKHFKDMEHAFMNIEDLVQSECALLFQEIGLYTQAT